MPILMECKACKAVEAGVKSAMKHLWTEHNGQGVMRRLN